MQAWTIPLVKACGKGVVNPRSRWVVPGCYDLGLEECGEVGEAGEVSSGCRAWIRDVEESHLDIAISVSRNVPIRLCCNGGVRKSSATWRRIELELLFDYLVVDPAATSGRCCVEYPGVEDPARRTKILISLPRVLNKTVDYITRGRSASRVRRRESLDFSLFNINIFSSYFVQWCYLL